jgi:glycerol-3-phosphate acyltransferase PlsY
VVGSIPFGLLIGKARGVDIREHGSKNIGATNVGRVLGRPWGYFCFALDVVKGAAPVLAAGWITGALGDERASAVTLLWWLGVAVAAVMGHVFPVWLRFRGGKGVATGFGVLVAIYPGLTYASLTAMVLWVMVVKATRYVSVASIVAALSIPISACGFCFLRGDGTLSDRAAGLAQQWPLIALSALLALLVVWKHRANIARLRAGTENRVGGR